MFEYLRLTKNVTCFSTIDEDETTNSNGRYNVVINSI